MAHWMNPMIWRPTILPCPYSIDFFALAIQTSFIFFRTRGRTILLLIMYIHFVFSYEILGCICVPR
uniref:Uncharacterized protein n=1 Tax=Rhizophora mucronata TaxID=61149 RepID=A0A2P2MX30_RHIMU